MIAWARSAYGTVLLALPNPVLRLVTLVRLRHQLAVAAARRTLPRAVLAGLAT
jgi:hypothetical protein